MSRRRSISTDISTDPKLAAIAEEYGTLPLLLYTWAIPHATDFGQITSNPTQFRLLVCPALPIKSAEVTCAIQQLVAAGLWRREGEEGHEYLQFPEEAWFRHQSYINASKRPNAAKTHTPAEQQQETPRNAAKHQETPQKGVSPSPSPSLTPSPSPSLTEEECANTEQPMKPLPKKATPLADKNKQSQIIAFCEFYAIYPVKRARQDAEKAWLKISPNAVLRETIMTGLANAKGSEEWQEDSGRYVPHPATFLNHCRWEDDYTPAGSRTPAVRSANGSNHPNTLQGVIDDTARAVRAEQSRQEALRQPLQPKGLFQ